MVGWFFYNIGWFYTYSQEYIPSHNSNTHPSFSKKSQYFWLKSTYFLIICIIIGYQWSQVLMFDFFHDVEFSIFVALVLENFLNCNGFTSFSILCLNYLTLFDWKFLPYRQLQKYRRQPSSEVCTYVLLHLLEFPNRQLLTWPYWLWSWGCSWRPELLDYDLPWVSKTQRGRTLRTWMSPSFLS